MSCLALKTFLGKAWAWTKNHWYVPMLFFVATFLLVFAKGSGVEPILELMDRSRKNYEDRVRTLEENHENEIRRTEEVRDKYNETIREIERQHNESASSLDGKKRKRIKALVENFHQDPGSLNEALEREFGFTNVE